jgi:hypothetical protein
MKTFGFILTMLFCVIPSLWIENYMFSTAFWVVFAALFVGRVLGYIEREMED